MNSFSVNSTFSKAQGKMCLLALVEKTCSKKLVKNAWNWRFCAFSTSSVKNVVESKAYPPDKNTILRDSSQAGQGLHYHKWLAAYHA